MSDARDAVAWFRERQRQNRKSPMTPSQRARGRAGGRERHQAEAAAGAAIQERQLRPGDRAGVRPCRPAGPRAEPRRAGRRPDHSPLARHPHPLRHTAATNIRKRYGLEAARAVLGQKSGAVAEVYAEVDTATVESIMSEVG